MVAGLTCAGAFAPHATQAAISYTTPTSIHSENFDTLPFAPTNSSSFQSTTGGWIDDTVAPVGQVSIPGFYLYHPTASASEGGTNSHQRMRASRGAGSGQPSTGAFYSYGADGSTERALGILNSGGITPNGSDAYIALRLVNNTGVTLNSFTLTYDGEQYRVGNSNTAETLQFGFSTTATGADWFSTATFTSAPALNFTAPNASTTSGQSLGSQVGITSTIGLSWAPGTDLWLRWADTQLLSFDDDGLGIDNLQFSASTAAGPSLFVDSVATGLASAPATWSNNQAPSALLTYRVNNGHTVTVGAPFPGNELRVLSGGVANIGPGGSGQALNSLVVEAGGNVTETVTGSVTIGDSTALNDGVSSASALGILDTAQNLTFNLDAGADFGVAMRVRGAGNIDFNSNGAGSDVILAGADDHTGIIRFNGTGDSVRLVKEQAFNRVEMNSTGANTFVYNTIGQAQGGVLTYNQNGGLDHASTAAGSRIAQLSVLNTTTKTVTVDLTKSRTDDERRMYVEATLQGSGAVIVNGAATDPTDLGTGGTNGITRNEFELGSQSEPGSLSNNSFTGTITANDYVNVELRHNLRGAKIVVNNNAVLDMGFPVVGSTKVMQYGEIAINNGGTLEVGFEASIAGGKIGRHVTELELLSNFGRSGSLTLSNGATTVMQVNGLGAQEHDKITAAGSIVLDGTLKMVINPSAFTGTNPLVALNVGDVIPLMEASGTGSLPADFSGNGVVDAADLTAWKAAFGMGNGADANGDGVTDGNDVLVWQRTLGNTGGGITGAFDSIIVDDPDGWMAGKAFQVVQTATSFSLVVAAAAAAVPEPSTALLTSVAFACLAIRRRR